MMEDTMGPDEQDDIQQEHLNGEHFGNPDPACWMCWDDDDEPEAPGID